MLLGGQAHWTVGLVATLVTISSIISADTFAFLGGKVYSSIVLLRISFILRYEVILHLVAYITLSFLSLLDSEDCNYEV